MVIYCFAGTHPNDVLKMPSLSRNGNGYWLDASTGGMVWRTQPSGDALDMQKDQMDDYTPVCLTNNAANGTNSTTERSGSGAGVGGQQQRYVFVLLFAVFSFSAFLCYLLFADSFQINCNAVI